MPRKPSFSFKKTPDGWKVEIPASLSPSSKRERAFFKTRDKARDYAEELAAKYKESGTNHTAIKPSLAEAALKAEAILAPTGANLIEAARAFRKSWDAKNSSCALNAAITDYLASRADLRDSTLKSYKYSLDKVLAPLHQRMMADIKSAELEEILKDKGATARAMHLRNIRTFWKWAGSPFRSWATMATVDALEASRLSSDADIEILKPDDVKALLEAAELEGPAAAAAYAIAVFGGVRMPVTTDGQPPAISFKPEALADAFAIGATLRLIDHLNPGMTTDPSGNFCVVMNLRVVPESVADDVACKSPAPAIAA